MPKSAKGSAFERETCRRLSLWWTDGKNDCVFWRTAGSGGRATMRSKKGIKTSNSDGDIMALDPMGEPFLKSFCLELKRGYSKHTLFDLMDKTNKAAMQEFESWYYQAKVSAKSRGSVSWMIISRRDKRQAVVFTDSGKLRTMEALRGKLACSRLIIETEFKDDKGPYIDRIVCIRLDDFLNHFKPLDVKVLV